MHWKNHLISRLPSGSSPEMTLKVSRSLSFSSEATLYHAETLNQSYECHELLVAPRTRRHKQDMRSLITRYNNTSLSDTQLK